MKKNSIKFSLCILITAVTQVHGQSDDVEVIDVYGQFSPVSTHQLAQSTYILEQTQINQLTGDSALDLLEFIPGVAVKPSGNTQDIFVRGAETNFIVIQIDGVQVNNPLDTRGGGFDLGSIPKSSVIRVELTKGGRSSVYGSDAIAGVLNFITLDSTQTGTQVSAGVAPKGRAWGLYKTQTDSLGVRATLMHTDKQPDGSQREVAELALRGAFEHKNDAETSLAVTFNDYQFTSFPDQSGGARFAPESPSDNKEGQWLSASIRHNYEVNTQYSGSVQVEYYRAQDTNITPGIAPYFNAPPTNSDNDYDFIKARWLHNLSFDSGHVTFGTDYKSEAGSNIGEMLLFGQTIPTNFTNKRNTLSGFLDTQFVAKDVMLSASTRYDDTRNINTQTTWNVGATWTVNAHWRLYASAGTAFKLPSLYALGNPMIGNSNLTPEEARNIDLGADWQGKLGQFSISVFQYQYSDLIDFDGATFSLVNRERVESEGLEVTGLFLLNSNTSIRGSVTYADTFAESGVTLVGRPDWLATLSMTHQWSKGDQSALNVRYMSETLATSLHTGDFSVLTLPSHIVIDITHQMSLSAHQRLVFAVDNLFDKAYQTAVGFPAPERGVGFEYHYEF
ncbi:TonB-dependent receptor [Alteromonas sp. KUL49]|uniref:TonB-dependent receptor plug domain-containing protein n=1 Tax=Alteromonas sp. KUL49 TaxID=2480798 RepID=UPI0013EE665A|nr:TonB-dependent receptor [Alteromonas sp. KUL49]